MYTGMKKQKNKQKNKQRKKEIVARPMSVLKEDIQVFRLLTEKTISREQKLFSNLVSLSRQQKNKATFCNHIVKDCLLSKSDIVQRKARQIYYEVALVRMVAPKHIYDD